jgi:dihydroxyacid dehydratase/phosphogluconate dehydratase
MGVVISNCDLGLPGWATGMIVGFASALPIVIVVAGNAALVKPGEEAKTVAIMLVNAVVLGGGIGLASRMIAR